MIPNLCQGEDEEEDKMEKEVCSDNDNNNSPDTSQVRSPPPSPPFSTLNQVFHAFSFSHTLFPSVLLFLLKIANNFCSLEKALVILFLIFFFVVFTVFHCFSNIIIISFDSSTLSFLYDHLSIVFQIRMGLGKGSSLY